MSASLIATKASDTSLVSATVADDADLTLTLKAGRRYQVEAELYWSQADASLGGGIQLGLTVAGAGAELHWRDGISDDDRGSGDTVAFSGVSGAKAVTLAGWMTTGAVDATLTLRRAQATAVPSLPTTLSAGSLLTARAIGVADSEAPEPDLSTPSRLVNIASVKAAYRRALGEFETIRIRRYTGSGSNRPFFEVEVKARVTGFTPQEMVGGIQQADRKAIVLADDLVVAGLALPVTNADFAIVGNRQHAIKVPDDKTRRAGTVTIAYELVIVGP